MQPQTATSLSLQARLVLARLLVPQKKAAVRSDVRRSLEPLLEQRMSAGELTRWLDETLADLASQELISAKPLSLTERGRTAALEFLGMASLPSRLDWRTVKNKYLIPAAIGVHQLEASQRSHIGTAPGLRAILLKTHFDLPTSDQPTLTQALDTLFAKQLRIGLRKSGVDALRSALLQKWLVQDRDDSRISFNLAGFAEAVRDCASRSETGRFSDRKIFINHAWNALRDQRKFPELDEAGFKQRLIEANRAGLLSLSRADLVEAMNPEDVRASETSYLNAVFHFVHLND